MRLDGRYGKQGHRRQRYRCIPANGEKAHRLAKPLPPRGPGTRLVRPTNARWACTRVPAPRATTSSLARGNAEALEAVGSGASYRQAALVARERARVDPETGEPRPTRHGQLVTDWVEVFAPVPFGPRRPSAWPEAGSLLLDDLPFSVRGPATGRFRIAFRVYCAAGFEGGCPKLWRLEAHTSKSQADWERFLGALGEPRRAWSATTTPTSSAPSAPTSRRPSSTSASSTCATRWSG